MRKGTMNTYYISEEVTREGMMTVAEAPERAKGVVALCRPFRREGRGIPLLHGAFRLHHESLRSG